MTDPAEKTIDRIERRKNPADMVSRSDFEAFKTCVLDFRKEARRERLENIQTITRRLDDQDETLSRINVALFAKDENNEFESPGVMTVMRKLDRHIDVVCNIGKWARAAALALIPIITAVGALGHEFGWF